MKKIFFAMLTAALLSTGAVKAAYIPQDVRGSEFEDEVELLMNLGFLDEYTETGMMKPYSNMTRAEFAQFLDGIIGSKSISEKNYFADVNSEHPARESINRLYEYGYISGDENSLFRPDDNITFNEVIKIMTSIMGYDAMAQYNGGYPSGYLSIAATLGITDNVVTDGEYINRGNIMKLLINCFDVNPVEFVYENGSPGVKVNEDTTVLEVLTGIYTVKGYINANSDYAISGEIANDGCIYVGDIQMFSSEEYAEYVGYYTECWYRENDNDEYEVVYIRLNDKKNKVLTAQAYQITGYNDYSLDVLFEEKKKETKLKFNGETAFIYNGKACTTFDSGIFDIENGWVEFLDNNSDDIYDVVKIYEYYNMVVDSVTEKKIYDKYNEQNTIVYDNADVRIFNESGESVDVSYIEKENVLSVFKSGDNLAEDIVKIVCSKKTVSGKVSEKKISDGIIYVKIGTDEYEIYNGYRTGNSTELSLNDSGEFLLDAYGKIVSMKGFVTGSYIPAFMIKANAQFDDESGEKIILFKVLNEQGVMYVKASEKLMVDGVKYTPSDFDNLGKNLRTRVGQVILYKLNSMGEAVAVDTTEQNGAISIDDRLTSGPSVAVSESLRWNNATKVIEGKYPVEDGAKVFVVPSELEGAEDDQFAMKNVSSIGTGTYMSGTTTYILGQDKMTADYLVIKGTVASMINHQSDIAIITQIKPTVNDDDEAVLELTLNVYGKEKKLLTTKADVADKLKYLTKYARSGDTLVNFEKDQLPTLGKGDIIKYGLNDKGYIEDIVVVYSASTDTMHSANPYHNDFHEQGYRYVQGEVKEKYGEYIILDVNNGARTECHRIGNVPIYEVDTSQKNIFSEISMVELEDSDTYGTGDKLIILTTTGNQIMTLVYR